MNSNLRFVTKGLSGLNLLRLETHADTCKGYSKMWFMAVLLVVLLAGCNGTNSSLGGGGTTGPTVDATVPAAGALNVAVAAPITATFSKAMDPDTITITTFTVTDGTNDASGTVALSADGLTATFTPDGLAEDTDYTATITTGAKDVDGKALAANKEWSFQTGPAPTVTATSPASGQPVATAISATFNEEVTIAMATFTVAETVSGTAVAGTAASADDLTVTFLRTGTITAGTAYTATLSGVKDLAGNPMTVSATWNFTPVP